MLQKAGGSFTLLADVNFGPNFGILSTYYKTRGTNIATSGQFRLANDEEIVWRDAANTENLVLKVNTSDILEFDGAGISVGGTPVQEEITVADTATIDLNLDGDNELTANIVAGSITNAMINAAAAIAYSKLSLANSIVNADISGSAAIAYSKLNLSGSIVNADVNAAAAIAYSKLSLTGAVVNADISASAAIAFSKLATLTSGNILVGSAGNVATSVAMSGDATIIADGTLTIANNAVTNAKLAEMATMTIKGNNTGGTTEALDLTATQVTAMLNNVVGDSGSGGTKGLVPAPASGDAAAGKFLKADGTWVAPSGSGDVVGPASSTDNGFVRFDGTTGKLLKDGAATLVNADISASAAIAFSKLASLTSGNILVGNGSNVATSVTMSGAITIDNAGATTYNGTVPLNKGGTGQTAKAAAFDALSPMTTGGDLIYGGASGTGTRLANGTVGMILVSQGGTSAPVWTAPDSTYTPTVAGVTNVTASTAVQCQFYRFGNMVMVFGHVIVDPASGAGVVTEVSLTLPIARSGNFSDLNQAQGSGGCLNAATQSQGGSITANTGSQLVYYTFTATDGTNRRHGFSFSYMLS